MEALIQFTGKPREITYLKENGYGEVRQMGKTSYYLVEKIGRSLPQVKLILDRSTEEPKPKMAS